MIMLFIGYCVWSKYHCDYARKLRRADQFGRFILSRPQNVCHLNYFIATIEVIFAHMHQSKESTHTHIIQIMKSDTQIAKYCNQMRIYWCDYLVPHICHGIVTYLVRKSSLKNRISSTECSGSRQCGQIIAEFLVQYTSKNWFIVHPVTVYLFTLSFYLLVLFSESRFFCMRQRNSRKSLDFTGSFYVYWNAHRMTIAIFVNIEWQTVTGKTQTTVKFDWICDL